ncbi:S1 family peptidase [Bdellovibrio bacteriovorus]|uniref:Serine protease n=1 Tax=Bdellovibrio bacteriovorus str. Tiberius TaxID=1069642 RepID=K7YUK1_BDEBC|nr:trypsin-like serine protease [Bdellovibrio bacteriovorus]AFY00335.1 serine protease [Bdellovibrio bacteriovorus str. Tiberius]
MRYLVLTLMVLVSACADQSQHELQNLLQDTAIAGGRDVAPNDALAKLVVRIKIQPKRFALLRPYQICTGAFVSENVILTAAHCVKDPSMEFKISYALESAKSAKHSVEKVVLHRDYIAPEKFVGRHDMALIRIDGSKPKEMKILKWSQDHQPLILPKSLLAIGYGAYSNTGNPAGLGILRTAGVLIQEEKDTYLVANQKTSGICHGDSGGPLLDITGSEPLIVGVNHAYMNVVGEQPEDKCRRRGAYMKVSRYSDWIEEQLAILNPKKN